MHPPVLSGSILTALPDAAPTSRPPGCTSPAAPRLSCLPSPFQSSGGAELWAAVMFIRWATVALSHSLVYVLGDNTQIVTILDPSNPPPAHPSTTTDGTSAWALKELVKGMPPYVVLKAAWIKGHAGFRGSEISDAFGKWVAYAREWYPCLLLPPPSEPSRVEDFPLLTK